MDSEIPNLSVVVLCYQTGGTIRRFIAELIQSLDPIEKKWELVLVGNYFKDRHDPTPRVVREIAADDPRIKVVAKVKEGMMGWDMISGLNVTTGKVIAVIDGDGQMPPEDIGRVYSHLKANDLDLVKTFRTQRDDGVYRIFLSKTFNFVFKLIFPGLPCRDINSKPKVFKREIMHLIDLKDNGWFIDAEIMIKARRLRIRLGEIPTSFKNLDSRASFVKLNAIIEFTFQLFLYRVKEFFFFEKK